MKQFNFTIILIGLILLSVSLFSSESIGQSRDQNFPTAITSNELVGAITARDIGDSRLTSYYYIFEGNQGDIFINAVVNNFSGDIDIFSLDGLRPLTKMVIYADTGGTETGRLIYLRKPERLLLRIQGRTPNDDPATFRLKFAGSFVAVAGGKSVDGPTLEQAIDSEQTRTIVNSVGTIIEVRPKPGSEEKPKDDSAKKANNEVPTIFDKNKSRKTESVLPENKARPIEKVSKAKETAVKESEPSKKLPEVPAVKTSNPPVKAEEKRAEVKRDPLSDIYLKIQLKNGKVFERPMSEVRRFNVDNGILIVVEKNGVTTRHSILDVEKVTIE